jgi:WD40 repeat protein
MKRLPYYAFTIQTTDAPSLVSIRLASQVEPPKGIRLLASKTHLPYEVSISEESLKVISKTHLPYEVSISEESLKVISKTHLPYEGTISEESFKIIRMIHYPNPMLPFIQGRFEQLPGQTVVRIDMTLHPSVVDSVGLFYPIWYMVVAPIALMGGWNGLTLLLIGLPLPISVVLGCAFWLEAQHSRRELTQILLGKSTPYQSDRDRIRKIWFQVFRVTVLLSGIAFAFYSFLNILKPANIRSAKVSPSRLQILKSRANPCALKKINVADCNFSAVHTLKDHPSASVLAMSADGNTLVSGGNDKALKVWDLTTGKLRQTLPSPSGVVLSVALNPDGKIAVSGGGDRMVRIWDLATGHQKAILKVNSDYVDALAIRPDGKTLVSMSWNGMVKIWDLATARLEASYNTLPESEKTFGPFIITWGSNSRPLALSTDGKTALIADGNAVMVWNLTIGKLQTHLQEFQFLPSDIRSGTISPDGKIAVIQYQTTKHDRQIKVWDTVTGEIIASQDFNTNFFSDDISITLDKQRIIGQSDGSLQIWNISAQKLDAVFQTDLVKPIVISPDGKTFAGIVKDNGTEDAQIKVWRQK